MELLLGLFELQSQKPLLQSIPAVLNFVLMASFHSGSDPAKKNGPQNRRVEGLLHPDPHQ